MIGCDTWLHLTSEPVLSTTNLRAASADLGHISPSDRSACKFTIPSWPTNAITTFREIVERALPELLAAHGAEMSSTPGAVLGDKLTALQPSALSCLLAALHEATRACLMHSCMCVIHRRQ